MNDHSVIGLGDALPALPLQHIGTNGRPESYDTDALRRGTTILFGVPGAFTPTCSAASLPSFVTHGDTLRTKGVSRIACIAVNDAFTMQAWGNSAGADSIDMLADWDASFCRAMGLTADLGPGMGERAQRFTLLLHDGIVQKVLIEAHPGTAEATNADALLAHWPS